MNEKNIPKKINVCFGKKCSEHGAEHIKKELEKEFLNTETIITSCECVGFCEQAPNVIIDEENIIHDARLNTIGEKIKNKEYKKITEVTFEDITKQDFLGDLF